MITDVTEWVTDEGYREKLITKCIIKNQEFNEIKTFYHRYYNTTIITTHLPDPRKNTKRKEKRKKENQKTILRK